MDTMRARPHLVDMLVNRRPRRRPKPPAPVRGEVVVRGALEATLEELAEHGYDAFRIEDVAVRAGVNKTTIYRRWPTKEDLVRAALLSITSEGIVPPETGSLRGDLLALARGIVELIRSCVGRGLAHILQTAGPDSELMAICTSLKQRHEVVPRAVIEAASARGELKPGVDPMLIVDVLAATINHRLVMEHQEADEDFLVRVVDLLLGGALRSVRPSKPDHAGPRRVAARASPSRGSTSKRASPKASPRRPRRS
jgi:AcrR family transcriptional regulator